VKSLPTTHYFYPGAVLGQNIWGPDPSSCLPSLYAFSLKIWHLVASDLLISPRIDWPQCVNSTAKFGGLCLRSQHGTATAFTIVTITIIVCQPFVSAMLYWYLCLSVCVSLSLLAWYSAGLLHLCLCVYRSIAARHPPADASSATFRATVGGWTLLNVLVVYTTCCVSVCAVDIGSKSVPKIIVNNTVSSFLKTAISILVISNHNGFCVLFDTIASVCFFICQIYLYFIIGNAQPRVPALCQLYRHVSFPMQSLISHCVMYTLAACLYIWVSCSMHICYLGRCHVTDLCNCVTLPVNSTWFIFVIIRKDGCNWSTDVYRIITALCH